MTILHMNLSGQVLTFLMVATDHLTGATGQSPTVRFSKNGATAFATATQTVTEMQYGWYKLTLATGNVDTEGELAVHATATAGDDTDEKHQVTPGLWANLMRVATTTVPAPNQAGRPLVDLTHIHGATATTAAAHFGVSVYAWATATGLVPAPNQPGRPLVDLTHIHGATATTGAAQLGVNVYSWATATGLVTSNAPGIPKVDLVAVLGTTATTGAAMLGVNVYSWATATGLVTGSAPGIPNVNTIAIGGTTATTGAALLGVNVYSWATATGLVTSNAPGIPNTNMIAILGTTATTGTSHFGVTVVSWATATGLVSAPNVAGRPFVDVGFINGATATEALPRLVWDEAMATHTATNTAGDYLIRGVGGAGATASDTWTTALPGAYAAGSAGFLIGTYLDAAVSSRSTATQAPTAVENADALLNRDMSLGTDSGSATVRTPRQALRFLRNKWTLATTGALTVYKEDDSTSSWTATATGDSSATPITGIDPA